MGIAVPAGEELSPRIAELHGSAGLDPFRAFHQFIGVDPGMPRSEAAVHSWAETPLDQRRRGSHGRKLAWITRIVKSAPCYVLGMVPSLNWREIDALVRTLKERAEG